MKNSTSTPTKADDVDNTFEQAIVDHPTTFWGTTFHLIFITAGSVAFLVPKMFVTVGYLTGCVLMPLVFLFYVYNMHTILWSAHQICKLKRLPSITYAQLVYAAFDVGPSFSRRLAPAARFLVRLDFIVIWFNTSVFVYLLMAEYTTAVCTHLFPYAHISMHQVMIALLVPVLAVSSIRQLKYLEPLSVIGFVSSSISAVTIFYYLMVDESAPPWQWPTFSHRGSIDKVPIFVGAILIVLNVTGLVIPLSNEMKSPAKFIKPWGGALTVAFATTASVYYSLTMIFAAKYDVVDIPTNIIAAMPPNLTLSHVSLMLYVLSLLLLYPLTLFVSFDVIWNDFLKERKFLWKNVVRWEYVLRATLVCLCFVLAYTNPDLSLFFSISGTVGTSIDSIIFPALVQTWVEWKVRTSRWKWVYTVAKNSIIFVIGLGLVVAGIRDCTRSSEL